MADDEKDGSDLWAPWRRRLSASRKRREEKVGTWQENVAKRVKTADTSTKKEVSVNQDWSMTKAKGSQLYSQTPEVRLTTRPRFEMFAAATTAFAREINETVADIDVGATIEEISADVVNAAGVGAVLVSCDKRTETVEVPEVDPSTLPPDIQQAIATGRFQLPMVPVEKVVDVQYRVDRISPAELLVPSDFVRSDYDKARWLGYDGSMTWTQAQIAFGLTDEEKDDVLGPDKRANGTMRTLSTDTNKFRDTEVVNFTEVFYWRHYYHPEEKNFRALQRLVFIEGLEEPKVNEPYAVQQRSDDGKMFGVRKNPIRVAALTYVSDESLPPSDSTIIRHSVNELEESRNDMNLQRKHSIPFRWGDTNRISANTRAKIDQGDFQGFIWTNGPGDRAIGEVSRAAFPPEKFELDKIIKNEITELAQVGTNQSGAFSSGERSAREAGIIEKNFQRRVGQEQDKFQKFFLGIVEVLAAHIAMYGQFDLPDEIGPMREQMANAFTYSVRADATIRKDADEQIEKLTKGLNLTAQSGFVNPKPVISKIWELLGEDASQIVIDPEPKPPEPVKVSVSKAEDLINPLFVALLMRTGQAPTPEDVAAAIKLLTQAAQSVVPLVPPAEPTEPQGDNVKRPGITNAEWETSPRIERRAEDGGA